MDQSNIVLIIIDTLRYNGLGCCGNQLDLSPEIDKLANKGIQFTQAISSSGWTLPAIGSIFTGTWPTIHGGTGKGVKLRSIRWELPTAAEIFKNNGFDNTFGFANCAFLSPRLHMDSGFDTYDVNHAFNQKIRRADETIAAALKTIRRHRKESNFIFIHLFDPHLDYDPPPGYQTLFSKGRSQPKLPLSWHKCHNMMRNHGKNPPLKADIDYIKSAYYGEIRFVDAHIGKLVDGLKKLGLYEKTAVVITSDHGEEFWEHGGFEHGHTLYDELIKIPMIMKLPSFLSPAKKIIPSQVRHIDIMPTLFDLFGITKPASFLGRSLIPYIQGKTQKDLTAFSESTLYSNEQLSWRTGSYKLIYNLHSDKKTEAELYNCKNDPEEKENLYDKLPEKRRELDRNLSQFYENMVKKVDKMSTPQIQNLSPRAIEALESLGYIK